MGLFDTIDIKTDKVALTCSEGHRVVSGLQTKDLGEGMCIYEIRDDLGLYRVHRHTFFWEDEGDSECECTFMADVFQYVRAYTSCEQCPVSVVEVTREEMAPYKHTIEPRVEYRVHIRGGIVQEAVPYLVEGPERALDSFLGRRPERCRVLKRFDGQGEEQ